MKLKITFEVEVTGKRAQVFIDNLKRQLDAREFDNFSPYGTGGGHEYRFRWEDPVIKMVEDQGGPLNLSKEVNELVESLNRDLGNTFQTPDESDAIVTRRVTALVKEWTHRGVIPPKEENSMINMIVSKISVSRTGD